MRSFFRKRPVGIKFVKPYQFYLEDMTESLMKTICNDKPIKVFNATTKKEELYVPKTDKTERLGSENLLANSATETF